MSVSFYVRERGIDECGNLREKEVTLGRRFLWEAGASKVGSKKKGTYLTFYHNFHPGLIQQVLDT